MACNSDYMRSSEYEKRLSQTACLLDELDGKPFDEWHWDGYHPSVYNRIGEIDGDAMVAELCRRLSNIDVCQYSRRMEDWWREHQQADAEREAAEKCPDRPTQLRIGTWILKDYK